ncbi:MAG TPA: AI-2E family transporter [Bacteroidia bacterium]|nr:AI-2E family transporter [Bacteroidia bacterium]
MQYLLELLVENKFNRPAKEPLLLIYKKYNKRYYGKNSNQESCSGSAIVVNCFFIYFIPIMVMSQMLLSFPKIFFTLATVLGFFAVLFFGKTILIPLSVALLLSFILLPIARRLEKWGIGRLLAAFLCILLLYLIVGGLIFFFSTQIIQMTNEFADFQDKLTGLFTDIVVYLNDHVSIVPDLNRDELLEQSKNSLSDLAGELLKKTFNNTASFLTGLLTVTIYTFLLLIYRKAMSHAFSQLYKEDNREQALNMFNNIQRIGQQYLSGMSLLILILGTANTLGLWIIGIDNPLLFGFLAATLSIIPYVGTTLGASIPVLYAFMTSDGLWTPIAITILFWSIQLIESNFLNPKVVGSSLKVNALAAILSLILGAVVWGIAGMILFLPYTAMFKVFCEEYNELKPVALLINDQNEEGKADRQINDPRSYTGGRKGITIFFGGTRMVELRTARKLPSAVVFGLQRDQIRKFVLHEWEWDDLSGAIWKQVTDSTGRKDAFYAYGSAYVEYAIKSPQKCWRIDGFNLE